ncbi:retrovirus-related pol polyprotein from transposon TNT 1-94 [Tanacetum coccineum]
MDSIISLEQKNTLAEYMILSGADNRPPMLDNSDSAEKIQADCDMKATNIILQVIPQVAYQSPPAPTQLMTESLFVDSVFAVPVFFPGDDPIVCLNKAMAFLTAVASSRLQGILAVMSVNHPHKAAFQTGDLDTYDSDCDDILTTQAVLMANISNYGSDIISEVPNSETYLNDMDNQSVNALQDFEQSPVMDFTDNEIFSDSNIIPYSQYLQETQQALLRHFNVYDEDLLKENLGSTNSFDQMEAAVHSLSCYTMLEMEIVKQAKAKQPLDRELDFAYKHATRIQELLVYVQDTCPNAITPSTKKVAITPMNNVKNVRFAKPLTSSSNIKQKSMFDGVHDKCLLDFVKNGNNRTKSAKENKKQNIWKPTGYVFTEVGFKWKPTGITLTIVGNSCPLTRFTSTNVVPPKQTTSHSAEIQKPEIKVYSRKPKNVKNIVVQIVLWYLDSGCSKHMTGYRSQLMNFVSEFLGTVRFGNDQIARIMGYEDYQLGNVIISRVYYIEGVGHNLFSASQFCDADLEVEFQKNTCFIRNLEGVDLLSGSRDTNLYTISLNDMLKSSPICLLSKASKTKSWLWHRRLSHLNFGTLNKLAKDGLARGIPRLKFQKDHLCSACALGKSKKSSHQPKAEDTNQEKLYLLHMDLCGPMRVASINGQRERDVERGQIPFSPLEHHAYIDEYNGIFSSLYSKLGIGDPSSALYP